MNKTKSILVSRTFWVAVVQAGIAFIGLWLGTMPKWGAQLLVLKSVLDIVLRWLTDKPVTLV